MNGPQDERNVHEGGTPSAHEAGETPRPTPAPPTAAPAPAAWEARPARDPRSKSALLAVLLSMMPGLGQVYAGYYRRGFMHILIVASLITLLANDMGALNPLLGLGLAFFWLYNMIDAGRRAVHVNMVLAARAGGVLPEDLDLKDFEGGSRVGGIVLVVVGFLFLMHTRWYWDFEWLEEWWPLGFILLGGYLIYRDMQARGRKG